MTALTFGTAASASEERYAAAVRAVVGDVLELDDGYRLRLAELAPGSVETAALTRLIDRPILWQPLGAGLDRTGAQAAAIWLADGGETIQMTLVRAGQALVLPAETDTLAAALLDAEDAAREASLGSWRDRRFRLVPAVPAPEPSASGLAIVGGTVVDVGVRRRYTYLNFGRDRRRDFTVRVRSGDVRAWDLKDAIEALPGRWVEARGYLFDAGGPMLEPDHLLQLRIGS